jgi:hypothetical protein
MAEEKEKGSPGNSGVEEKGLLPATVRQPPAIPRETPVKVHKRFPENLPEELNLVLGNNGIAYAVIKESGNSYALRVGSRDFDNVIMEFARREGITLRRKDLNDLNHMLQAHAERKGVHAYVWLRVAPIPGGIEIDLGDESHTRARITAGKVEILTSGSETLFCRSTVSRPMVMPTAVGNLDLLRKYLCNLHPTSVVLLIAWASYILAHPKQPTTKYPILVIIGGQGSGKSFLCYILSLIIDPSLVGVRILPNNARDLAIAAQNSHVLYFDNVRGFSPSMADILCIASTGGALSTRQLYTDAGQQILNVHAAIVLNGIHSFIDQPDLAQRCLPLHLKPIPEETRRSDAALVREFQADLPAILRGIFDLIADIFRYLPEVEVTNPERMIDFVNWLAAMEKADGVPTGIYQTEYSTALCGSQLDSLQENLIAAAILEFVGELAEGEWEGTPARLLNLLNAKATRGTQRSREWPQNAIALSKRLAPLQAGLSTQGIEVQFSRGKERIITITVAGNPTKGQA